MPSLKYSLPGSPVRLAKGTTAIEDISGMVGAAAFGPSAEGATDATGLTATRRADSHTRSAANPIRPNPTREATIIAILFDDRVVGAGACTAEPLVWVTAWVRVASCIAATSLGSARAVSPSLATSHCELIKKDSRPVG